MATTESSLPIARRSVWRDDCLELVCGIANAGGGRLILDADVDSRGVVKRKTNRVMRSIPGAISQALDLTCAIELVLDGGRFCLEVVIPPASEPISYRGAFYFYQDGTNRILDGDALDRLLQPELEPDIKWETRPVVQASLDDLNLNLVARFTGTSRDTDLVTALDEASAIEEDLRHAGLMTGVGTPTNVGILLLHDRPHQYIPGATVRIGFFGGRGGTPIFEDEIYGSLIEQVHATVETLYDKYLSDVTGQEDGISTYSLRPGTPPRDAVHEAVLNALAHKNYDSGTPVQVSVFTDRICIDNVGRPPRTWTVSALLGRHTSRPNNPTLVAALRRLGVIDGWGHGSGSMRLLCMEAGGRAQLRAARRRDHGLLPTGYRFYADLVHRQSAPHREPSAGAHRAARGAGHGPRGGSAAGHEPHPERREGAGHDRYRRTIDGAAHRQEPQHLGKYRAPILPPFARVGSGRARRLRQIRLLASEIANRPGRHPGPVR